MIIEDKSQGGKNTQDPSNLEKKNALVEGGMEITGRKKLLYSIIFFIGLVCSYPTLFPIGIVLAAVLLFKKNSATINLMGVSLLVFHVIFISAFLGLQIPQ